MDSLYYPYYRRDYRDNYKSMSNVVRAHLFVSGRVQGVFFRAGAQAKAREFGVTGWARNLLDGRVELIAEGEKEKVEQFVNWCTEGTPLAKVQQCEVGFLEHKGEFDDFSIREFGF